MSGLEPVSMVFIQIPTIDSSTPQEGKLVFVGEDGKMFSVKCTIADKNAPQDPEWLWCWGQVNELNKLIYLKMEEGCKIAKEGCFSKKFNRVLVQSSSQEVLDKQVQARATANRTAYVARLRKNVSSKEGCAAIYGARVFHFVTGILAMQIERIAGVAKLALASLAVAGGALALLGVKGVKNIRAGNVTHLEITEKRIGGFVASALWHVRVALLQLIPIIGPQLANQYRETGSLKDFMDAPAIGGLLGKIGGNVAQIVYGPRSNRMFRKGSGLMQGIYSHIPIYENAAYLSKKHPTLEDAKLELEKAKNEINPRPVLVRIPVEKEGSKTRYHDGTLIFCTKEHPKLDAPTVIMYHPNAAHRDQLLGSYQAITYLQQGYNVLLASYSGDFVTAGDGNKSKEVSTHCTETLMREDARADIRFLQHIGVKNIGMFGDSLGCAQAMNAAAAIQEDGPKVDFITLHKGFSDAVSAVGRIVKNVSHSSILARIGSAFARRFFLEETEGKKREGCDCLDNKAKLREIVTKKSFQNTRFTFIGGNEDVMMGDKKNPDNNFAAELYLTVADEVKDRAKLMMVPESHGFNPYSAY